MFRVIFFLFLGFNVFLTWNAHADDNHQDSMSAVSQDKQDVTSVPEKMKSYGKRIASLLENEKYEEALKLYEEMLKELKEYDLGPDAEGTLFFGLASLYFTCNRSDEIVHLMEQCYEKNEHNVTFLFAFICINGITGDYEKTSLNLSKMIHEFETHPGKYDEIGWDKIQTPFDSSELTRDYGDINIFLGSSYYYRSFCYAFLGDIENAKLDMEKFAALAKFPVTSNIYYDDFMKNLNQMEKEPGTIKVTVKKNTTKDYFRIDKNSLEFLLPFKFIWEEVGKNGENVKQPEETISDSSCPLTVSFSKNETENTQTKSRIFP